MNSQPLIVSIPYDQSHQAPVLATQLLHTVTKKLRNTKHAKRCARGLDKISPFLHEVNKIITEQGFKHTTVDTMPWYTAWKSWKFKDLFKKTSKNSITTDICPDLHYNQRTIKFVVEGYVEQIMPIQKYISITHLFDKSAVWTSQVKLASFESVRVRIFFHVIKLEIAKNIHKSSVASQTYSHKSLLTSNRISP